MKYIIAVLLLISTPIAKADDYGLGHAVITYVAGEAIRDANARLFQPEVALWVTRVELAYIAYRWCDREATARGSWAVSTWGGDSAGDCLTPMAVAGYQMRSSNDGFVIPLFDYRW